MARDDVAQTSRPRLRECRTARAGKRPGRDNRNGKTALCKSPNKPAGVFPSPSRVSRQKLHSMAPAASPRALKRWFVVGPVKFLKRFATVTQVFPQDHRISTPLTRHWPGATSRFVRNSCTHCSSSGQREQVSSRMSGRPTFEPNDACSASMSTIARLPVSGQVTILGPPYAE